MVIMVALLCVSADIKSFSDAAGAHWAVPSAQRKAAEKRLAEIKSFLKGVPDQVTALRAHARSAAGRAYAAIAPPRPEPFVPVGPPAGLKPPPRPPRVAVRPRPSSPKPPRREPVRNARVLPPPPPPSPSAQVSAALADLRKVAPDKRHVTRYLSLTAVPEKDRERYLGVPGFTLNSMSWRSRVASFPRVGDDLVRVDLTAIAWDKASRAKRLAELQALGVAYPDEAKLADIWETIAAADPYYFASQVRADGSLFRGWLDPKQEEELRYLSQSSKAILRADWLVSKLWVESKFGGYYSQVLLLPAKEADLYKLLAIDIKRFESEPTLRHGAAVPDSDAVAHFNRELQVIPGAYGEVPFLWRTFDFAKDGDKAKDVFETLAGTAKHDGREIIFSLPNNLHGYYLSNGAGDQAAVVPQDIALDRRNDPGMRIRDRNVLNGYKCVDCHGPHNGIWPFLDKVGELAVKPGIGLAVISKDKDAAAVRREELEEYYLTNLSARVDGQTATYASAVRAASGLDSTANSRALIDAFNAYTWGMVTLDVAAAEMGLSRAEAVVQLRRAANPQLVILSSGTPIRRANWERSFPDAMQGAERYPWEGVAEIIRHKALPPYLYGN